MGKIIDFTHHFFFRFFLYALWLTYFTITNSFLNNLVTVTSTIHLFKPQFMAASWLPSGRCLSCFLPTYFSHRIIQRRVEGAAVLAQTPPPPAHWTEPQSVSAVAFRWSPPEARDHGWGWESRLVRKSRTLPFAVVSCSPRQIDRAAALVQTPNQSGC